MPGLRHEPGFSGVRLDGVHKTPLGGKMNSQTPLKHKTIQFLVASFLILSMLAGILSACTAIVIPPIPTDVIGEEFSPSKDLPATQELTLVSPTEMATEIPTITLTPEPTATATATATATEKPLIEGDIFYDPQSKEDFKKVALSPSPFDNPEKFALWHEEYFKQINEKLENYNGPTVELTESRYNGEDATMEFVSEKWPVAGSYRYKWQGEDVLNKTYIFSQKSDGDGFVLLNVTYFPESIAKMTRLEYKYGKLKEYLAIQYNLTDNTKEWWPNAFDTDFDDTFHKTEEQLDSLFRIFFHKPEKGDEELFSRMQFIYLIGE